MNSRLSFLVAVVFGLIQTLSAYTPNSRRAFLATTAAITTTTTSASSKCVVSALDMDAFIQSELSKDSQATQLSEDAALCKYGFPSPKTGEACVRAGLPTTRLAGGVDAFGQADRGDFVRCKQFYDNNNNKGQMVKRTVCSDGTER